MISYPVGGFPHQPENFVLFCDVCLQRKGIHAVADLQYWGYRVTF